MTPEQKAVAEYGSIVITSGSFDAYPFYAIKILSASTLTALERVNAKGETEDCRAAYPSGQGIGTGELTAGELHFSGTKPYTKITLSGSGRVQLFLEKPKIS